MTKEEVQRWIFENCSTKFGDIDLSGLNFYGHNVYLDDVKCDTLFLRNNTFVSVEISGLTCDNLSMNNVKSEEVGKHTSEQDLGDIIRQELEKYGQW